MIEEFATSRALIRRNIETLGVIGETKIWRRDATRLGPCRGEPFTLIFADPPYRSGLGERALASAQEGGWIGESAVIVLELASDEAAPAFDWAELADQRTYGETQVLLLKAIA